MRFLKKVFKESFAVGNARNQMAAKFQKKSFSQSGEDLIVDFIFRTLGINFPSYIDIGAHHPYYLNNTAIFYRKGCRGINVEPDPSLFSLFLKERKEDTNLDVGISDKQDSLDFFIMNVPTLNTFSKSEAENYSNEGDFFIKEVRKINVRTVGSILKQYNNNVFPDFLSLDAEGVDEVVLKSIDFYSNRPTVICVETISFSEKGKGVKNTKIIQFLEANGYMLYADTYINSIFVTKDKWER